MSAGALRGVTNALKAGAKIAMRLKNLVGAAFKSMRKTLRQTLGPMFESLAGNNALRSGLQNAVKKSAALAAQAAEIAKKGGATIMKKMKTVLGSNPKFMAALGKVKGVAATVGEGFLKYTKKCATSKRCAGALIALTAVGFIAKGVKDRLDKLDEIEAQCMADCLPTEDPAEPGKLTFKSPSEEFPIVCDGTEETGDDGDTCTQYCIDQCTDVAKKCKEFAPFLPNIACDAAGAAADGISGFPGNVLDGLGETFKTILRYVGIAIGALIGISLILFIAKKAIAARLAPAPTINVTAPAPAPGG